VNAQSTGSRKRPDTNKPLHKDLYTHREDIYAL